MLFTLSPHPGRICSVTQLEENIREKCDEAFKEKITLQEERDLFVRYVIRLPSSYSSFQQPFGLPIFSAISAAIGVMIREVESACEPHFNTLSRTSWSTVKQVTGQSVYVQDLLHAIEQIAEIVKPVLEQKKYARNYFDKISRYAYRHPAADCNSTLFSPLSSTIFAKFTNAIVRSRPLLEIGAEQVRTEIEHLSRN